MEILVFTTILLGGRVGMRWTVSKDRFPNADLLIGVYEEYGSNEVNGD